MLGDLEEEYRSRVRPENGQLRAQAWYTRELIVACAFAVRDRWADRRPVRPMHVAADARDALRRWRRRPGFAVTAVLTLALGIGTTTALFSVVDTVLLQPPPWPDADRLVAVHAVFPERRQNPAAAATWNRGTLSYAAWDALRADPRFGEIGAWRRRLRDTTFGDDRTAVVEAMDVSSALLPMLGVGLSRGRHFTDAEDDTNSDSLLITYDAWQRRFGGREDIIGQPAFVGDASSGDHSRKTIVGVLAPGFAFDDDPVPEVLLPVGIGADASRRSGGGGLRLVGRLAPDASRPSAEHIAAEIVREIDRREPTSARLVPLADEHWHGAARPLWVLFGGAALLLLVACSNAAGLVLGEGRARRHEIAVRTALGSSRWRLVRQLIVEHALLALVSSAAGLTLANWLIQAIVAIGPTGLPRLDAVAIDARVAAFALVTGALTLLLFGTGPALSLARTPAAEALAQGGRDPGAGRHLTQRAIVAGQVALALVLLVGATLLGETLFRLMVRPLGFDPRGLATISFAMTWVPGVSKDGITAEEYVALTAAQRAERLEHLGYLRTTGWWLHVSSAMDRVAALPHVTGVAAGFTAPFVPGTAGRAPNPAPMRLAEGAARDLEQIRSQIVSENYFEVMGIPLIRGRGFEPRDRRTDLSWSGGGSRMPRPVVISREFERRFFDGSAVGRVMIRGSERLPVIGVVENVRWRHGDDPDLATYYTLGESYSTLNTLVVRADRDPAALLPSIRNTLRDYDPNMVVTATATMETLLGQSLAEERFRAALSTMFGGAALVLSAVGLYGLCTRRVADRRREIAVRVALGARPANVRALVLADAWRTVGLGLAAGIPAAIAAAQLTRAALAGVAPPAPRLFLVSLAVLAAAALAAMVLPSRRAARIDPMVVLKE
jgi:predicted permease